MALPTIQNVTLRLDYYDLGKLKRLYLSQTLTVDRLPYTGEMEAIHIAFVAQSGIPCTEGALHQTMIYYRKAGDWVSMRTGREVKPLAQNVPAD